MNKFKCKKCTNNIEEGELIIKLKIENEIYFCSLECEADYCFVKNRGEKNFFSSDNYEEGEREEYFLSNEDLEDEIN
jgi:hypothetical protein